jgi:hypothetical protein
MSTQSTKHSLKYRIPSKNDSLVFETNISNRSISNNNDYEVRIVRLGWQFLSAKIYHSTFLENDANHILEEFNSKITAHNTACPNQFVACYFQAQWPESNNVGIRDRYYI